MEQLLKMWPVLPDDWEEHQAYVTHLPNSAIGDDPSRISGLLRRGTVQSGLELFAAYGIKLVPAPEDLGENTIADMAFLSVAGFSGPQFSGIVVLGTTEAMLRRSNTTASSSCDWMAELGNQLIGRIKNRLLKEGISIYRVPPAVMQGHGASLFYARTGVRPVALTADEDTVFIWTESEMSFGTSSIMALGPDTDVLAEGEMILF